MAHSYPSLRRKSTRRRRLLHLVEIGWVSIIAQHHIVQNPEFLCNDCFLEIDEFDEGDLDFAPVRRISRFFAKVLSHPLSSNFLDKQNQPAFLIERKDPKA